MSGTRQAFGSSWCFSKDSDRLQIVSRRLTKTWGTLCLGLLLSGCSACSSSKNGGTPDLGRVGRLYFVAEDGSDEAPGTRDQPFRTLGRAMNAPEAAQLFVSAGVYREPALQVRRSIEFIGPGGHQAVLEGRLDVQADSVSWSGIDISAGLRVERSEGLFVKDTRISPGDAADTVILGGSTGDISDLGVICGRNSCLQVEGSTVALSRIELGPPPSQTSDRVLRVSSSSVAITGIQARSGILTQVQVERGSDVTIRGGTLGPGAGTQLVSNLGSKVRAFDLEIPEPGQLGALAARGELRLVRARVGSSNNICVGTQGGHLILEDTELGACAFGSVSSANHNDTRALVQVRRGVVRHGRFVGINHSQGRVEIDGTRFEGIPDDAEEGDDAILASSPAAELIVRGAIIENATGNGVGVYNGARADVRAVIRSPRLSGIMVGSSPGGEVRILGSEISGCRGGSGVVVFDSTGVRVETTVVSSCQEAGLIAGDASEVTVDNGTFENNTQFGIAAFGGSTVTVTRSAARGSPWATFASCGDGARVEDAGDNRFEGPTTECF